MAQRICSDSPWLGELRESQVDLLKGRVLWLAAASVLIFSLSAAGAAAHHHRVQGAKPAASPKPRQEEPLRIVTSPASPVKGHLVLVRLQDPPRAAARYQWELQTGAGSFLTSQQSAVRVRFSSSGAHMVRLRLTQPGMTRVASLTVIVRHGHARSARRLARPSNRAKRRREHRSIAAQAASDPSVIIADFQFTPATQTIQVGDTVTWTNSGPSPHTATASDGSFDTGTLRKGQSASHTFTSAGTLHYICSIHPFMHGTIVVEAAAKSTNPAPSGGHTTPSGGSGGGGNGGGGQGTLTPTPNTSSSQAATSALPMTGDNLILMAAIGLLLAGIGLSLRWISRAEQGDTGTPNG